jgi:hypothetical protein
MARCLSGHENKPGASFCSMCGTPVQQLQATGIKSCTRGHPMGASDLRCGTCGNPEGNQSFPQNRVAFSPSANLKIKFDFSKYKKSFRDNKSKVFKIGISLSVITALATGYWIYSIPNYSASSFNELFKNRNFKIESVLTPLCGESLDIFVEQDSQITSDSQAIDFDYKYALDSTGGSRLYQAKEKVQTLIKQALQEELGTDYLKIMNPSVVLSSGFTSLVNVCEMQSNLDYVSTRSNELEKKISAIRSPGSWEPSRFIQDDSDPNIAWDWGPSSGAWAVDVKSRLGCRSSIKVYIDGDYGFYSGTSGPVSAGGQVRVYVYGFSTYLSENGSIDSITCNN